jgi:hypothetical protein
MSYIGGVSEKLRPAVLAAGHEIAGKGLSQF